MATEQILKQLEGHVWDTHGNKRDYMLEPDWYGGELYAGQCVSLIKAYFKIIFGTPLNFGNAWDYYRNQTTNGILKYCDPVYSNPKDGDIAVMPCLVWNGEEMFNFGHVMIRWKGGYLSQNVDMGAGPNPRATWYPDYWISTITMWFRPKANLNNQQTKSSKEEKELMLLRNITFSFDVLDNNGKKEKTYVYSGDDNTFTEVKDADELKTIKEVYKGVTGKDMFHKQWYKKAPYYIRFLQLVTREPASKL